MSIFSTILQKLGLQKPAAPAAPIAAPAPKPVATRPPQTLIKSDTAAQVPPAPSMP